MDLSLPENQPLLIFDELSRNGSLDAPTAAEMIRTLSGLSGSSEDSTEGTATKFTTPYFVNENDEAPVPSAPAALGITIQLSNSINNRNVSNCSLNSNASARRQLSEDLKSVGW